ncbi:MAG: cell division protein FtsQ/DivIB [Alphaproteobacteria bacterium]
MRWLSRTSRKAGKPTRRNPPARRRRAAPRWLRPACRITAIAGAIAFIIGGPAWLWHSGWITTAMVDGYRTVIAWSSDAGLTVQNVTLEGRVYTSRRRIMAAVGLKRGDPLYGFDPGDIHTRLTALSWVRQATVERRMPDTVHIRIVERRPLALWQRKGKLSLVDHRGKIITRYKLRRFRNLLIIVGDDAPQHAVRLIAMLGNEPKLALRVNAAVRIGKRRWNLELKGGIKVRLPEADAEKAWRKLARLERRHRLLDREVTSVDMRQPDRLIVVTPTGAQPVKLTTERNT